MKNLYPTSLSLVFLMCLQCHLLNAQSPVSVTAGTSDNGLPAHIYTWTDAANLTRTATLVDQRPGGAGYLRTLVYKVNGVDRICRGTGANGHQGDGYLQNHTIYGGDNSSHGTAGTTSLPLQGRHHSIIDFYMPNYTITSPGGSGGTNATVPSRVQWFFATGRDYPIFSMTQDARLVTAGNIGGDSRSPYGDFHYDGNTNSGAYSGDIIGGSSWGDTHKWVSVVNGTTNESTTITTNSGWRYDEVNTIPYAMQWTKNVNAEMGHVCTQPMTVKDMGRNGSPQLANTQQLNGPMIGDEQWCYQILAYGILSNTGGVTKRLTWGTNWGYPGGFDEWGSYSSKTDFTHHGDGARTNGMLLAYSVWEVLGIHTGGYKAGSVGKMVTQMENMQLATLSSTIGTVKTSGPAGVGLTSSVANNVPYIPMGYNQIFATWEVDASANAADIILTAAAGKPIESPIFVLNGYSAATTGSICINGAAAVADVDYFATIDASSQKLWVTVNRTASPSLRLQVNTNTCQLLLPLDITAFTGRENDGKSLLHWETGNGITCTHFNIERSNNGRNFQTIGSIDCNAAIGTAYSFTDENPSIGANYYRLQQVDANGVILYSKTIQLDMFTSAFKITALQEKNSFLVVCDKPGNGSLKIMDGAGKIMKQLPLQNQQTINLDSYPAGLYYVTINTNRFTVTKRIVRE
ncbi:MAG: T9SS type A sorting domain-containing protein [Chitinophagaceae bacterium]